MKNFKFELGVQVKCKITGFKGTVIARIEHITGCDQYSVRPKGEHNKLGEAVWFDELELEQLKGKQIVLKAVDIPPGGPKRINPQL